MLIKSKNCDQIASANNMQHTANQNVDGMSDAEERWVKTHSFSVLHHTRDKSISTNDVRKNTIKYQKSYRLQIRETRANQDLMLNNNSS